MKTTGTIQISVIGDRNATVAEALGWGWLGLGSSKREPGDPYDIFVGEDLAVARALRNLADHLESDARAKVARSMQDEGCVSE